MEEAHSLNLEDAAPLFQQHVLPLIEEAVAAACKSFQGDDFNDNYVFGTTLWRNLFNRVQKLCEDENSPFRRGGKGKDHYDFIIDNLRCRHHRVRPPSFIPRNAKAAKSLAYANQLSFEGDGFSLIGERNVILAIDANPIEGLREVFLGVLGIGGGTEDWIERVPIEIRITQPASIEDISDLNPDVVPTEPEIEDIPVTLGRVSEDTHDIKEGE